MGGRLALGYHSMKFWNFPIFSNFLRSLVSSCSATRKATRTYHVTSNNRASFHLWGKGNLVKHQKVSKYYENDYRSIYVVSMWFYFCFVFIFIMINSIISWIQTCLFFCLFFRICPVLLDIKWMINANNFRVSKVSICLIFCQFQPGVAYKSVAYKKSAVKRIAEKLPSSYGSAILRPYKSNFLFSLWRKLSRNIGNYVFIGNCFA